MRLVVDDTFNRIQELILSRTVASATNFHGSPRGDEDRISQNLAFGSGTKAKMQDWGGGCVAARVAGSAAKPSYRGWIVRFRSKL